MAVPGDIDSGRAATPRVRLLLALTLAHVFLDMHQGAIPAMLPFLRDSLNLSYTLVGSLVTLTALTSSLTQPLIGLWCDRKHRPWALPVSLMIAGVGLAAAGFAPSFAGVALALAVSALGWALFHPEATRTAFSIAGRRRATGFSWFVVGGNLGFTIGPLYIVWLLTRFSLPATAFMLVPALVGAAFLAVLLPAIRRAETEELAAEASRPAASVQNNWRAQVTILTITLFRSFAQYGLLTFVPIYMVDYLQGDPAQVSALLFFFMGFGTLTTLAVGPLADRVGRKPVLLTAMLVLIPVVLAIPYASALMLYPLMALAGASVVGTWTVTMVLHQEYLPKQRSLGSALGMATGGIGGVIATPLGMLGDAWGLVSSLQVLAVVPVVAALLTLALPGGRGR